MHTPLILVSGRQRQVNIYEFKSSLSIQRAPGQPATQRERQTLPQFKKLATTTTK